MFSLILMLILFKETCHRLAKKNATFLYTFVSV